MNPIQNPLFKEPVGASFKIKREKLGLSIDDVAKSLKFGTHLVNAMENEQWEKLGPAIYAKSYISSYIKLLGMDEAIKNEIPSLSSGTASLKTISPTRVEPAGIQSKSILIIVTLLGLLTLLAYLYYNAPAADTQSIDNSIPLSVSESAVMPKAEAVPAPAIATPAVSDSVAIASESAEMNLPAQAIQPAAAGTAQLVVRTKQESWLEIRDTKNAVIFSELIPANQERTQALANIGKITLGNAANTELLINNSVQNISAFIKDDGVARFTVDANGNAALSTL